jgi:hypothetical protein
VSFRTERTERVISVLGVVFAHYGIENRAADAFAMITLWESEYASQIEAAGAGPNHSAFEYQRMQQSPIAGRLCLSEKAVRKRLRRLGWRPHPEPVETHLEFEEQTRQSPFSKPDVPEQIEPVPAAVSKCQPAMADIELSSFSPDPLDRSIDRLLAKLGRIEDAEPLFAPAVILPRA